MQTQQADVPGRILAKIVRELLTHEQFETLADLTDALKCRCARLRVRWTPAEIAAAYRLIASNTALTMPPIARHAEIAPSMGAPMGEHAAAAILARLGAHVRAMPSASVPRDEDHEAARRRAWEMGIEL